MSLAEQYIQDVLDYPDKYCLYVRQCVKRHLVDLEKSKELKYPFYFNVKSALHSIKFFSFLKFIRGNKAGQSFKLEPWQEFFLWCLFGWKYKDNNERRFKIGYIELPRKNGISTFLSAIGLYLLFCEKCENNIYSLGFTQDKANILYQTICGLVNSSEILKSKIHLTKDKIKIEVNEKQIQALSINSKIFYDTYIGSCLIDNISQYDSREFFRYIEDNLDCEKESLMVVSSNSNNNKSIGLDLHKRAIGILNNSNKCDDLFFAIIYTIDKEDNPLEEKSFYKANPNLNVSCYLDDFNYYVNKLTNAPNYINEFKKLKLNVW